MTLTRGRFIGHEYDRMIVRFSMHDGAKEIPCAITTSAMDYLSASRKSGPSSEKPSSSACRAALKQARQLNIARRSSKAPRPASCCEASILGLRGVSGRA